MLCRLSYRGSFNLSRVFVQYHHSLDVAPSRKSRYNSHVSEEVLFDLVLHLWCASLVPMSSFWDDQRRQARAAEARVDTALNEYSRLATELSRGSTSAWPGKDVEDPSGQDNHRLEQEIEKLLNDVSLCCSPVVAHLG